MNTSGWMVALAGTALLCSCAVTTQSMLEARPPAIQAASQHSVAELTACISDNLKVYPDLTANYVPAPNGGTLNALYAGHISLSVHIVDNSTTREITAFGPTGMTAKMKHHRLDSVRRCL